MKTKDSEHLQWLHNRIVHVYGESPNVDFLNRFREIMENIKKQENNFEEPIIIPLDNKIEKYVQDHIDFIEFLKSNIGKY